MFEFPPFWMYVIGPLLLLGPLITIHELGHYLVGRWFGVKAEAFSVGFGKELIGRTDKHGTRWKISALPLGGYVQFKGDMDPASVPNPNAPAEEGSFQRASLGKRALIVAAGPITNLIVAVAIFAGFFWAFGQPVPADPENTNIVEALAEESPAGDAGVQEGDRVLAIDGDEVRIAQDVIDKVIMFPGQTVTLTIDRDGEQIELPVEIGRVVDTDQFGNSSAIGRLGVMFTNTTYEEVGLIGSIGLGFESCWRITKMMTTGIWQVISGQRSIQDLGGPVKIAKFSGERLSLGALPFIELVALISLNLAFINFLPIPALDGGHLAFYAVEAVRKKPVGPKATEWAYRAGIAVVLALMVVVTVNDVITLPFW